MFARFAIPLLLAFLCLLFADAQVPANPIGLNPTHLKWQQIHTDKVQVIFPAGLESQGQRVANLVHQLWEQASASVGEKREKVSILLQNQPALSNGFVTVGPFRSELFTTPPQFDCSSDWLDLLTLHEYRHVQQFANALRGPTRLARKTLGSWAWGGLMATALPRWYFEGDAVGAETALSRSGRGRLPAFDMEYRALLLEGRRYHYEKAGAGSFKDFVPSWYPLGYYMTTYARREFGKAIWQKVMADAVRYKGLFFPFSRNLKKHSGLSSPELYRVTFDELAEKWLLEKKKLRFTTSKLLNTKAKKTVTHFNHPHYLDDGSLIAEKRSFDQIPAIVQIDQDGKETLLTRPGIRLAPPANSLSIAGGKICWAEINFDPRWRYQSFSVIRLYDIASHKKRQLTTRSRYFSPALSPASGRIIAVAIDEQMAQQLVILDAQSGAELQRLPNPESLAYSYPAWTADEQGIVVVAKANERYFLQIIDLAESTYRPLSKPTAHQITHPFVQGDTIIFAAGYTGINNIFAANLKTNSLYQLTSVPIGAFHPTLSKDAKTLAFSEFSAGGFNIKAMPLAEAMWADYQPTDSSAITFFEPLVLQEGGPILDSIPQDHFAVSRFNSWNQIIYPHSILPFTTHPIYGAQILSDNKFGTLSASAGTFYNTNDNQWTITGNLSYAQLYPIINLSYRKVWREELGVQFAPLTDTSITRIVYAPEWQEDRLGGGLALPLNLSRGHYSTQLFLRADAQLMKLHRVPPPANALLLKDTLSPVSSNELQAIYKAAIQNDQLSAIDLRMVFRTLRRRAVQHLNPRLGLNLDVRYRRTLGGVLSGDVLLAGGDIYLPGLSRNHSLVFNVAYKQESLLDNYRFTDFYLYPRGYSRLSADEIWKFGINYSLPLWYPDLAIGPLAFLKRVKMNGFFDRGIRKAGFPFDLNEDFNSAGAELTFDIRALRLLEIDFGLRYSYLFNESLAPDGQRHQFDFLVISISEQ